MKHINNISTKAPSKLTKTYANKELKFLHKQLYSLQNLFYAEGKHSLLIILQGMDTSGKDGTIRHVFSCVNPQGCNIKSFKSPTAEEQLHDFLWRINTNLPERRMIQIFNRSHYEDVLFPVVHKLIEKKELQERYNVINNMEKHLKDNNTIILKFYLHISQKEQKGRLKKRLTIPEKRWKHDPKDEKESEKWKQYLDAYQNAFEQCSKACPWIIVPADDKWYRTYLVAKIIVKTLENLKMKYSE